ncbi:glycosyltransferase [Vibrio algarum]|uniref:Glycosyltransferase n=1 Tax=Vibrio algarum TaxID=3020714 RepID=A0ABT4YLK1_9VIBR|nr:glycosyltransferase [Vibrio sp. KJ40-1]MDB1122431.1 glycosyltransferase [Vibrio sp. KJ40-1]
MKVVVFSENNYGCGASIAASRLVKGLTKEHEVLFVYEKNKTKINQFKGININTWQLGETQNRWKNAIYRVFYMIARLTSTNIDRWLLFKIFNKKIKSIQPDIIHFHNTYFTHEQIAALSEKTPVVWTMHDQFAFYIYNYKITKFDGNEKIYCPIQEWRKRFYNPEKLLNNCNANVTFTPPSQWLVDLSEKRNAGRKAIKVVHNGIDTNDFYPLEKHQSRKSISIDAVKFTLLFLAGTGAWERKNSIVIFEALKLIPDLDIQVVAIGSVSKFKFEDSRVIKKGAVYSISALREVYSSADVFCIPSVLDNLPNTVLESLLCGTPVLGAKAGGIPEMIDDGNTGWLFDPYSPRDLADKITMLYNDFENVKNKSETCRSSVIDKFSEGTMVKNYIKVYNEIVR